MNLTELLRKIEKEEYISFYGAQMVASSVYTALKTICNPKVKCFIVSSMINNPQKIDGIEVMDIEMYSTLRLKGLILIATPIVHHETICSILKSEEMNNFICIDSVLENMIMAQYYKQINKFSLLRNHLPDHCTMNNKSVNLYMVKSPVDCKLSMGYNIPEWCVSILAGSVFAERQDAQINDNVGDNISDKNRNYCELTATYWVWKHANTDYVGICHYRRILELIQTDLDIICHRDVDVILPMPTVNYPNAEEHHKRYISEADWDALKVAITELAPEYEKSFLKVFGDIYFYNFNIFLAKKQVFYRFCEWMFPILQRVEQICETANPNRKNRYMGYIGESLTALYFMENKDKLSIEHTGNIMLI